MDGEGATRGQGSAGRDLGEAHQRLPRPFPTTRLELRSFEPDSERQQVAGQALARRLAAAKIRPSQGR